MENQKRLLAILDEFKIPFVKVEEPEIVHCTIVQSIEPVDDVHLDNQDFFDGIVTEPKQEANEANSEVEEFFAEPLEIFKSSRVVLPQSCKICNECDYKTTSSSCMVAHKCRKHGGPAIETKFLCHLCPKTFKKAVLLKRHLDKHNNVKRFTCGELI